MKKTYLIDGRVVFHSGQNELASQDNPNLTEILNEPCARCLEALLDAEGNIVPQAELYKAGWGEAYKDVAPNTLYQNILLARKAFRKIAESDDDFIITVPRKGFRFNETMTVTVKVSPENSVSAPDKDRSESNSNGTKTLLLRDTAPTLLSRMPLPVAAIFIILALVIFIAGHSRYGATHHDDFTSEYDYAGAQNGCEFYVNKRQTVSSLKIEQLVQRWPGTTANCSRLPQRYITPYRNYHSVFYLSCNGKNKAERICSSGYLQLSE
ncbi:winged helix-turn-helix domain-containing protein [Enterobacter bugandensis]